LIEDFIAFDASEKMDGWFDLQLVGEDGLGLHLSA
jgi:hypothetical protein